MFYQNYLDCGREFSDFYDNTPRVSATRNESPRFISLRWDHNLDPSKAVVEFFNYNSIVPYQQATTITSRDGFSLYPRTSPNMVCPISSTVAVPPYARSFRIRLDQYGPLVSNIVPVNNNNLYYYENGLIYNLYSF